MNDQRKDSRKKLMAFTPVYDSISRNLLGYVGNINLLGLMLVSEHPAEVGREVILNIEFPSESRDMANPKLIMPAHIVWCKPSETPNSWTIGFEFKKLTLEQENTIQAILERYHFRHTDE